MNRQNFLEIDKTMIDSFNNYMSLAFRSKNFFDETFSFYLFRIFYLVNENGITLCEDCHIKIHQKFGYDSKEKMI